MNQHFIHALTQNEGTDYYMQKKIIIYATVLLLVTLITVSGTYAFFSASANQIANNMGTYELKVLYSGDTEISGYIELVKDKEDGFRRVVSIAQGEDSVPAMANIYIYLSQIDEGFSSVAMKWEIYELNGEEEKYINSGTFDGYQNGERIYMVQNLKLTEETKEYAIYLWLNGYEAGNEVVGATLRGFIGAETQPVTGITS